MKPRNGFTLVELIVVIGIVALIASITLANFPKLRSSITLDQEVRKVSVALRRAQQFAMGVRRFDDTLPPDFAACSEFFKAQFPAYGVVLFAGSSLNDSYAIYADPDCNNESATYSGDLIQEFEFEHGVRVEKICLDIDNPEVDCSDDSEYTKLDIWYIRPGPRVSLTAYQDTGTVKNASNSAKITFKSTDSGLKKSIIVRTTGQITIKNE